MNIHFLYSKHVFNIFSFSFLLNPPDRGYDQMIIFPVKTVSCGCHLSNSQILIPSFHFLLSHVGLFVTLLLSWSVD